MSWTSSVPKLDKDVATRKKHRPVSSISIDAKVLNKIGVNIIQQYIEKVLRFDHVELHKDFLALERSVSTMNPLNRLSRRNIWSTQQTQEITDKHPHSFMLKTLGKLGRDDAFNLTENNQKQMWS